MPVISDPGETIIQKLKQEGIEFTIIPGANAGLSALILSGLSANRFTFIGFLPEDKKEKSNILNQIKYHTETLIFYVAPHDVKKIVKELFLSLGQRNAVLVNEITKIHEKVHEIVLCEDLDYEPRGEYVLVVEGFKGEEENHLLELSIEVKNDAIKKVAKERNLSKNDVYQIAIKI